MSGIAVPVRTFDTMAISLGIPRVDLMKIDVGGANGPVLDGMARRFATAPPRPIICETRWHGPAHRLLIDRGYPVRMLDEAVGGTPNLLFELGAR